MDEIVPILKLAILQVILMTAVAADRSMYAVLALVLWCFYLAYVIGDRYSCFMVRISAFLLLLLGSFQAFLHILRVL